MCFLAAIQFFFTYPEVSSLGICGEWTILTIHFRLAAKLSRRSKYFSATMDHTPGKLRRDLLISSQMSMTLPLPKLRVRPGPVLRRWQRRRRRLKRLARNQSELSARFVQMVCPTFSGIMLYSIRCWKIYNHYSCINCKEIQEIVILIHSQKA